MVGQGLSVFDVKQTFLWVAQMVAMVDVVVT
jgi:hypothetical protein